MVSYVETGHQAWQKDDVFLCDLPLVESLEPIPDDRP